MKLGLAGIGNMASAIITNVIDSELVVPKDIFVFDPDQEKLKKAARFGIVICGSNTEVAEKADIIILAVKPQNMADVLDEIKGKVIGKCLVSIAAGISTSYIKKIAGEDVHVLRVMPNTPMMIGKGAIAVAIDDSIPQRLYDAAVSIFSAAGEVAFIQESQMNEIIGVNGSSPAFFFRMADAMVCAAQRMGIHPDVALKLVAKTMEGASAMLIESGLTPGELIANVSSRGGTTVAALSAFDEYDFDGMINEAMVRCTRRAYELGK